MEIKNITFSYETQPILNDISFSIQEGSITSIMGANGCGKSTLLNLMSKNLVPKTGTIALQEKNIANIPMKTFAKKLAIVHQNNTCPYDLSVKTLVGYGRVPYMSFGNGMKKEDYDIIEWAMDITKVNVFQDKSMGELSGGQRQRVWIAMALAQKSPMLLLDEPTTFLDIRYQLEILNLVKKLNMEHGITIVMVLHDINHALQYSDALVCLKNGGIIGVGKPQDIIKTNIMEEVYDVHVKLIQQDGLTVLVAQ